MTSKMLAFMAVVASAVTSMMSFADDMRVRYALTFGDNPPAVAQFIPGMSYVTEKHSKGYVYADATKIANLTKNATEEMLPYLDVYKTVYYGKEGQGNGFRIELQNLDSNVKYKLRLHTVEFYYKYAGARTFRVYVNDAEMHAPKGGVFDCYAGLDVPHYYDITNCYANADGEMNVFLANAKDKLTICGIELFEPTNAPCYKPNLQVKGYQEFACIIPESQYHRSSTVLYDIEYRDGGEGAEVETLSRVWGGFVYDTTPVNGGVTREYRVRIAQEGNENWSDWVSAGDRSVSALTDSEGQTLLPIPAAQYENTGIVSVFHKNASNYDASAMNEESVTDTVTKNVLNWTQADVPESCAGEGAPVRILTSGKIWFPYMTEGCKIVVKGSGLVNLWMDDGWMKIGTISSGGTVTNEFKYTKKSGNLTGSPIQTNECAGVAGMYDFYVEQLQSAGSDIATSIEFIDNDGNAIPVLLYPSDFTADISPWKYHQLHHLENPTQTQAESYVVPLNEERTAFRIFGSGNSTWGSTDGGSLMYQRLKGPFEITMRINSISDVYDKDLRFGFGVRGGLGTGRSDKFLVLAGYNPRQGIRPMVFVDEDLSNGIGILAPFQFGEGTYKNYPVWLKLVNTTGVDENGNRVFNLEFFMSSDGETWTSYTKNATYDKLTVPRSDSVYVGPIVVSSQNLGTITPWMEIDNLELIDNSVLPMMIIIR